MHGPEIGTTQANLTSGPTLLKFSHKSSVPVQIPVNKFVATSMCVLPWNVLFWFKNQNPSKRFQHLGFAWTR